MNTAQLAISALGGAAFGALITALVTLYSGHLSRRHDHKRWLLDKRLEAYTAMNTSLAEWLQAYTGIRPGGDLAALSMAMGDLADKQQGLRLLASPATQQAAQDLLAVALAAFMGAASAREERRAISDEEADAALAELATDGQTLFTAQQADLRA